MIRIKKNSIVDIISILCIYFASMVALIDSLNPIALYGALPFAFIIIFFNYNVLTTNKSMCMLTFLYLWLCICYPFSGDFALANAELKRVLGSFILCYTIAGLAKNENNIPYLYFIPIILLIAAWIYAKNNIMIFFDYEDERVNDAKLNANTLAYYTFYFTTVIYLYGEILKNKLKKVFRVMFFLVIPLSFITAILTASRQVLLIQVPLILVFLLNRYRLKSLKNGVVLILIVTMGTIVFFRYGVGLYENSMLQQRNEMSIQEDTRVDIIKECLQLAVDKPLFGYGPGNSVRNISTKHFAHNTFLELLVNTGVIGMLIFLFMLISFTRTQYKRWKRTHDNLFIVFLIFILFWFVDQMFYVFYMDLWLMSLFILISSHSNTYYRNHYINFNSD